MHATSALDNEWIDFAYGLGCCLRPGRRDSLVRDVEDSGFIGSDTLACLSPQGAFDLFLQSLELAHGLEVIFCPGAHPGFARVVEAHGLRPVPVELDRGKSTGYGERVVAALTPRTAIVVVAHEFGQRIPVGDLARVAARRRLILVEHCVEPYARRGYRGHERSHVVILGFGRVDASASLPGALIDVRIPNCYRRMRAIRREREEASRLWCARRIAAYALRGVRADDRTVDALRRRPSAPVLRLLLRRMRRADRPPKGVRRVPAVPRGPLHHVWRNPFRAVPMAES